MEQRLSVIALGVEDLDRARRFYETGLGWEPSSGGGESIVYFQAGGTALALYSRSGLAEEANLPGEGTGFGGITLAHNTRSREEVDRVLAEAQAAGAKILKSAQDVFWGGYSGYFADPDGHAWEVVWNPHWELAEDGSLKLP